MLSRTVNGGNQTVIMDGVWRSEYGEESVGCGGLLARD